MCAANWPVWLRMAPEKTDPDSCGEDTPNTSTVSVDSAVDREPYFEPVVTLPEVHIKTNEEEEVELLKLRCKLFRYHTQDAPAEWKERGTGDVKILQNKEKNMIRVLMRQDKTLRVRANHYITPFMELKPNCNSDRAWVWSTISDFADEEPKHETFAIRFANSEHAKQFKEKFDEARGIVTVSLVKGINLQGDQEEPVNSEANVTQRKNEQDTESSRTSEESEQLICQQIEKEFHDKLKVTDNTGTDSAGQ